MGHDGPQHVTTIMTYFFTSLKKISSTKKYHQNLRPLHVSWARPGELLGPTLRRLLHGYAWHRTRRGVAGADGLAQGPWGPAMRVWMIHNRVGCMDVPGNKIPTFCLTRFLMCAIGPGI